MLTTMLNALSAFLRFWLNLIAFLFFFVFLPMVLVWLAIIVIVHERAGQTPFWR